MFPEIDSLPGTKRTLAIAHRQLQVGVRQHTADMRRHVIRSFCSMCEHRISVGHLARHEGLQIPHNSRIRVLADHQRCTGVAYENVTDARADARILNCLLDLPAQVVGAPALC